LDPPSRRLRTPDRNYRRCGCPKHLNWDFAGKQFRQSAKTASWEIATRKARAVELEYHQRELGETAKKRERVTLEKTVEAYLDDKRSQQLKDTTLTKLETIYFSKEEFAKIVDATYVYDSKTVDAREMQNNATRLRALTHPMPYSGLTIRDAITLERSRLSEDDKLFCIAQRPACLSTCPFRTSWRRLCGIFRLAPNPTHDIFLEWKQ
jgi:hypothetical protein